MFKKVLLALLLAGAALSLRGFDEDAYLALKGAVENAAVSAGEAGFDNRTVAVLPIPGDDDGALAGMLKNALTASGITVVSGKNDPMWEEMLKEFAWNERKNDILDPATIIKFGKIKAANILIYGNVTVLNKNESRIFVEIELHATDIATQKHLWGGNFAYRLYKGKDIQGIVSLDYSLRDLLKKSFNAAKESLSDPKIAGKLDNIKTVTVIPLSGDIDQYLTGVAIETLTQTRHLPQNPQIPSLSQIRSMFRNGTLRSDAIFYGAVRDLSRKAVKAEATRTEDAYEINADIQLFLEDAKGNVLWSKTITLHELQMERKELSESEKNKAAIWDFLEDNTRGIVIGIVAVLALVIIGIIIAVIRSATSVR